MRGRDRSIGGAATGRLVAAGAFAFVAAAYLTYLAVAFIRGGCDCGGGREVTAAGVVRTAVLIGGAVMLYAIVGFAAVRAWGSRR